jgi:endonuclease YncB( thermonuclease family)
MKRHGLLLPVWSAFTIVLVLSLALSVCAARAATAIVRDGNTVQLGDVVYRLDGLDAPELDQICIDDHADPFSCGVDAREQLSKLIGGRNVHCDDLGPDKVFRNRHVGVCRVEGDAASLNQQLVSQGLAVSIEPAAKLHLKNEAAAAKADNRGLWKGCFTAPQDFRTGQKDGALMGASCRADRDAQIRGVLFPEDLAMPPSCSIKAKFAVRARLTGNVGVYHLQGCRSYAGLTRPDRWFCSEDDAKAAGFRRAFNCRAPRGKN